MDKTLALGQLVLSVLGLLCTVVGGIGNIVMGGISSLMGYAAVMFFVVMAVKLVGRSWKEYTNCK